MLEKIQRTLEDINGSPLLGVFNPPLPSGDIGGACIIAGLGFGFSFASRFVLDAAGEPGPARAYGFVLANRPVEGGISLNSLPFFELC